jgi:hypothetical protein
MEWHPYLSQVGCRTRIGREELQLFALVAVRNPEVVIQGGILTTANPGFLFLMSVPSLLARLEMGKWKQPRCQGWCCSGCRCWRWSGCLYNDRPGRLGIHGRGCVRPSAVEIAQGYQDQHDCEAHTNAEGGKVGAQAAGELQQYQIQSAESKAGRIFCPVKLS